MEMPRRLADLARVWRHRGAEIQLLLAQHTPWQTRRTELQTQTLVAREEAAGKGLSKRQVTPRCCCSHSPIAFSLLNSQGTGLSAAPCIIDNISQAPSPKLVTTVNIHPVTAKGRAP